VIETSARATIASVIEEFVREELSAENAHIAAAVADMLDAGGKHLRPRITMLGSRACVPGSADDPVLAAYMEMIHVATLIHDDVVDGADVRRGVESTNHAFGNRFSVLAGDYLFSWVFKKVTQSYPQPVPTILAAMLAEICNGEVRQLRAAGNADLPEASYAEIIGKKTAELFAACAECGAIVAIARNGGMNGAEVRDMQRVKALRAYGWSFGMAFQVRDDLLDAIADERTLGKPAGSDLREKKVTLPLIHALRSGGAPARAAVDRLFAHRDAGAPDARADLAAVVDIIRDGEAVALTSASIARYASAAETALLALAPSDARDELAAVARSLNEIAR
jgi:geranylgeranyl pyrophosphate synthase